MPVCFPTQQPSSQLGKCLFQHGVGEPSLFLLPIDLHFLHLSLFFFPKES